MNIKWEFRELFNQACFLMAIPFMLIALVSLGIAWLAQQVVFILDPEWQEIQDRMHPDKEDTP